MRRDGMTKLVFGILRLVQRTLVQDCTFRPQTHKLRPHNVTTCWSQVSLIQVLPVATSFITKWTTLYCFYLWCTFKLLLWDHHCYSPKEILHLLEIKNQTIPLHLLNPKVRDQHLISCICIIFAKERAVEKLILFYSRKTVCRQTDFEKV